MTNLVMYTLVCIVLGVKLRCSGSGGRSHRIWAAALLMNKKKGGTNG